MISFFFAVISVTACSQPISFGSPEKVSLKVDPNLVWQHTWLEVKKNTQIKVTYLGGVWSESVAEISAGVDADGIISEQNTTGRINNIGYQLPSANPMQLIGKVGRYGTPFKLGKSTQFSSSNDGELLIAANKKLDQKKAYCSGSIFVNVQVAR